MVRVENLEKYYDRHKKNEKHVLQQINIELPSHGLVAVVGESGCGKTTLLRCISGLDHFDDGRMIYEGKHVIMPHRNYMEKYTDQNVAFVFRNEYMREELTVEQNVRMALIPYHLSGEEEHDRILLTLEAVGMEKYKNRRLEYLSGGQMQRVAVARALVKCPKIIFADEPTGNLDEENTIRIMQLLRAFSQKALVVLVSHEQDMVRGFADRIIHLENGRVVSDQVNNAAEQIRRMEWKDIYLEDYQRMEQNLEHLQIRFYEQEEEMQEETEQENTAQENTIQIIHRNHKFFVKWTGEEEIILLKDSECKVIDGPRPEYMDTLAERDIGLESISQNFRKRYHLTDLFRISSILAGGHGRWSFIRLALLLLTVITFLIFTDYRSRDSLNKLALQTTDSHMVTFDFSQGSFTRSGIELFYNEYLTAKGYSDMIPALNDTMNVQYDGYLQLSGHLCKVQDFSMISVKEITTADVQYGRMPHNHDEIVIDRWLLKRARQDNNILRELFPDDKQFLGQKVSFITGNPVTIVGIGNRDEPSVYSSDTLRLSMAFEMPSVISDEEISQIHPKKYKDLFLNDDEVLVSERILAQAEGSDVEKEEAVKNTIKDLTGVDCVIAGYFTEEGYDYIIPEDLYYDMVREKIIQDRKFYAYADSPQKMITEIQKDMKRGDDQFPVVIRQTTQEQFQKALEEKHAMLQIDYEYLIAFVTVVFVIIIVLIWLQILSQREEITVSRLVGLKRSVLWRMKMLKSFCSTVLVCLPVIMVCWIIVQLMSSNAASDYFVDLTWWMALLFGSGLTGLVTAAYGAEYIIYMTRKPFL